MKQSWIVGIVMIYFMIFGLNMIVQTQTSPDGLIWDAIPMSSYSTNVSSSSSVIMKAIDFLNIVISIVGMVFLYFPAIFSGHFIWLWVCLCLPIAIGFIVSIGTILRGVSSG